MGLKGPIQKFSYCGGDSATEGIMLSSFAQPGESHLDGVGLGSDAYQETRVDGITMVDIPANTVSRVDGVTLPQSPTRETRADGMLLAGLDTEYSAVDDVAASPTPAPSGAMDEQGWDVDVDMPQGTSTDDPDPLSAAVDVDRSFQGGVWEGEPSNTMSAQSESDDIDLNDPDVQDATVKIQAGFRGMMARKKAARDRTNEADRIEREKALVGAEADKMIAMLLQLDSGSGMEVEYESHF